MYLVWKKERKKEKNKNKMRKRVKPNVLFTKWYFGMMKEKQPKTNKQTKQWNVSYLMECIDSNNYTKCSQSNHWLGKEMLTHESRNKNVETATENVECEM